MKPRSPEFNQYKTKEFLGDAMLRFVAGDIFIKRFANFDSRVYVPKIDLIIRNFTLIIVAKKMKLIPHPEDVKECAEYNVDKPYANAFEVHLYETFLKEGIEGVYDLVEKNLFTPEILANNEKWYERDRERRLAQSKANLERFQAGEHKKAK